MPRFISLVQTKRLQMKVFCYKINRDIMEAPVNDHRAFGLLERLLQTIKNRLA